MRRRLAGLSVDAPKAGCKKVVARNNKGARLDGERCAEGWTQKRDDMDAPKAGRSEYRCAEGWMQKKGDTEAKKERFLPLEDV